MLPSGAGYPQQRKGRCSVSGELLHERLLAIGFLDYSFKTMLRQCVFLTMFTSFIHVRCLFLLLWVFFCLLGYGVRCRCVVRSSGQGGLLIAGGVSV